ncbi:MAG: hypothetical protein ACRD2P_02410 [Terriglobia bacterium]
MQKPLFSPLWVRFVTQAENGKMGLSRFGPSGVLSDDAGLPLMFAAFAIDTAKCSGVGEVNPAKSKGLLPDAAPGYKIDVRQ